MTNQAPDYARVNSRPIRWLMRSPIAALAMHWTFQSLLYLDPTERWFKISIDVFLTGCGALLLSNWLPAYTAWPVAFLGAHTLNFLLNGHLWGVLKHYGVVQLTREEFTNYVRQLEERAHREPSIQYVAVVGSVVRRQWQPSSDLDVRIVRHPGTINGLRACWFVLCERSRALADRFPLDLYIADSEASLPRLGSSGKVTTLAELSLLDTSREESDY